MQSWRALSWSFDLDVFACCQLALACRQRDSTLASGDPPMQPPYEVAWEMWHLCRCGAWQRFVGTIAFESAH